jgi:hypothetical protein
MKNNETENQNIIEKKIELATPISRVWQAITDSKQFGFENVPAARRDEAFRMNTNCWTHQVKNIEQYLALAAKTN